MSGIPSLWRDIRNRFEEAAKEYPNLRMGLRSGPTRGAEREQIESFCEPIKVHWREGWFYWCWLKDLADSYNMAKALKRPWPSEKLAVSPGVVGRVPQGTNNLSAATEKFSAIASDAAYALCQDRENSKLATFWEADYPMGGFAFQWEWGWVHALFHVARERPPGTVLRSKVERHARPPERLEEAIDAEYLSQNPFTASVCLVDFLVSQKAAEITPQVVAGGGGTAEAASDPRGDQTPPEREQGDKQKQSGDGPEWSKVVGQKELRTKLDISQSTLKDRLVDGEQPVTGKYRCRRPKPTARKIQVAVEDMPEHLHGWLRKQVISG